MNKKRKKVGRMRGSHTHGRGFKKKARGKGHRGGIGMSGSGKQADQKKTLITKKFGNSYFGRSKTRKGIVTVKLPTITLETINHNVEGLIKKGKGQKKGDVYELDLKKYKIIGNTGLDFKAKINAKEASKGAVESVKKSGGEIVVAKKEKKEDNIQEKA